MRREVDGVVQQRAAGLTVPGDRSGAGAGVDGRFVDRPLQFTRRVGVVGQKVDVDVERNEEGLILGRDDVLEELRAGLLLERKHVGLRAGGVEQNTDGQREIFFLRKVLELLLLLVFEKAALIFAQAGEEAGLVAHGEVDVDEIDVDLDRLVVVDGWLLRGSAAGWRRAGGRRGFLRVERKGRARKNAGESGETNEAQSGRAQCDGTHISH